MSIRSMVSALLALVITVTSTSASAFAESDDSAIRDAELMEALHIIDEQIKIWTAEDWQEFGLKAAKYALVGTVIAGAGAAIYYFRPPRGFGLKRIVISAESLSQARQFVYDHGGKVALAAAAPVIITTLVNRLTAMNNLSDAERLRTASTPDARVYRSHLRHFFRLTLSEQFLIARQDEVLMQDLLRLAKWIQEKRAKQLPAG